MASSGLDASVEKMRAEGVPDAAIDTFAHYYEELQAGASGLLPESEIEPVGEVPDLSDLPDDEDAARQALDRTVVIKLNGGLGTSMGMTQAKSLLEVKDGLTFLDVIVRQTLDLRRRFDARVPLVLMNSFYTRDASLAHLERYPELESDVPLDFVQNKEPKLLADDLQPAIWPDDPALEWCPPGHGDVYTALLTSGMLEQLLERGYEHAFISNSDNLGATLDLRILGWLATERPPFAMEVTERTPADRKGGHLAQLRDGGLVLRETAQVSDEDSDAFQDVERHRYANTNNLWVALRALSDVLDERDGVLGLPLIVNRKTVDPSDKSSPEVLQLETAMGAAIGVFEGARAVSVPRRERFAPVKTTNDLLVLRSDVYELTDDSRMEVAAGRDGVPSVELDSDYYKLLADFDERFAAGPPSLVECERLSVQGDVAFGRGVVIRGTVEIEQDGDAQRRIEDGEVLGG